MMPCAAMLLRKSQVAGVVNFVGAGTIVIRAGVTSVMLTIYTGSLVGDLFLAVVMRRSAATALPPGWTLLSSTASATFDGGVTTQYTDVYARVAQAGDLSFSFGQTSSGRMIGQIIGLRGNTGTPALESQSTAVINNTSTMSIALPSIASAGNGRMGVAVGSSIVANSDPASTSLSFDNSWSLQSVAASVDNRMGVATKSLAISNNTAGNFNCGASLSVNGLTANALIFSAP